MIYVTIFQTLVFLIYVGYVTYAFGVLPSISESHYKFELSGNSGLFTVFCFALGFPMFAHSYDMVGDLAKADGTGFFFVSMMLCFTGAATQFKRPFTDVIHMTGAILGVVGAVAGISVQFYTYYWVIYVLGLIITLIATICYGNRIWWVEVYSFAIIIVTFYIIYL